MSKSKPLDIAAEAQLEWSDIEAADGENKTPSFTMLAYTGAAMRVGGFYRPVIVDLSGVKSDKTIPIFRGHDPERIVGHGTVEVTEKGITATGLISAENEHSRDVISSSRKGFPWQASIGASVEKFDSVKEGDSTTVNGRTVKGPVLVARKSTLNEISFVPLGADRRTSAKVAAKSADSLKGTDMKFSEWLQANEWDEESLTEKQTAKLKAQYDREQEPVEEPKKGFAHGKSFLETLEAQRIEKERIGAIDKIAAEYLNRYPLCLEDIQKLVEAAHADKTTDVKDFKIAIIEATHVAAIRPWTSGGKDAGLSSRVVEAAICKSLNVSDKTLATYGDQTLEAADRHFRHGIGLQQLLFKAAAANGQHYDGVGNLKGLLQASMPEIKAQDFSTFSLSGVLSNVMNKTLLDYFNAATDSADPRVAQVWRQIAAIRPVRDFKTVTQYALTGDLQYEKLPPTGEIKHGTLGEQSYTNKADTYAKMMAISRTDIINDDLGALQRIPQRLGRGAALAIFDVFWTEFLNNTTFFVAGNNNVSSGEAFDATGTSLSKMEVVFAKQTDPDGKPLGVAPSILLVPPSHLNTALRLMNSTLTVGGSNNVADANVLGGRYRVYSSQYMENTTYTGNSATATYLLANPSDLATIEVVFLNGREAPIVESADVDFNTLGIQMRGYHDFGVAKQEPRGGVRHTGAS